MRKLATMLLGISLLGAPAVFAAKKIGGGKKNEKNPPAAKAKSEKAKPQSAAGQKTQK